MTRVFTADQRDVEFIHSFLPLQCTNGILLYVVGCLSYDRVVNRVENIRWRKHLQKKSVGNTRITETLNEQTSCQWIWLGRDKENTRIYRFDDSEWVRNWYDTCALKVFFFFNFKHNIFFAMLKMLHSSVETPGEECNTSITAEALTT